MGLSQPDPVDQEQLQITVRKGKESVDQLCAR